MSDPPAHLLPSNDAETFEFTLDDQSRKLRRKRNDGAETAKDEHDREIAPAH